MEKNKGIPVFAIVYIAFIIIAIVITFAVIRFSMNQIETTEIKNEATNDGPNNTPNGGTPEVEEPVEEPIVLEPPVEEPKVEQPKEPIEEPIVVEEPTPVQQPVQEAPKFSERPIFVDEERFEKGYEWMSSSNAMNLGKLNDVKTTQTVAKVRERKHAVRKFFETSKETFNKALAKAKEWYKGLDFGDVMAFSASEDAWVVGHI